MSKSEDLPQWLVGRRLGKAIVMNRHNGAMTQGLIEKGKGAVGFWQVSGYVPDESQVVVLANLTNSEAQEVFDADPLQKSFLEPVWSHIKDNWITVHVHDREGGHAVVKGQIPRTASVDDFLDWVQKLADEATRNLSTSRGSKPRRYVGEYVDLRTGRLEVRKNRDDISVKIPETPKIIGRRYSFGDILLIHLEDKSAANSPLDEKIRKKRKKDAAAAALRARNRRKRRTSM